MDDRGEIVWEFYRKQMANRLLMQSRRAMPTKMKSVYMTQEALRILSNTSPRVPLERVDEMLSDFCLRMKLSGYPEKYIDKLGLQSHTRIGLGICWG